MSTRLVFDISFLSFTGSTVRRLLKRAVALSKRGLLALTAVREGVLLSFLGDPSLFSIPTIVLIILLITIPGKPAIVSSICIKRPGIASESLLSNWSV